ncbi:cupredoxin domain-containing protein [Oricola indica]|jgi:plastocyanin|uniref:cupredoxin domain-containing protein n=1 Tax=Oricola indica TaxID=2872591 RepID=UPI001CBCF576|nr:cupredoxin family copper-binding protein [Oricola indica]
MTNRIASFAVALACLAMLPAGAALAADHTVTISGFAFQPAAITVAAGDTITFVNEDGAPHTATAGDGSFDTGRLNKGDSASVTVASAGAIDYTCNFHSSMKGTVTVQ